MTDTKSVGIQRVELIEDIRKLEQLLKRLRSQDTPNTRLLQADIESRLADWKAQYDELR